MAIAGFGVWGGDGVVSDFHERNARRRRAVLARCADVPAVTFAYLAGFLDGEGSVMPDQRQVYGAGRRHRQRHQSPTAIIKVGNTDPKPLRLYRRVFGGTVRREKDPPRAPRNKAMYTYRVYENTSSVIVEKLLPHLITKRPHAKIAQKIYRLKATLSPKEFLRTPELYRLVHRLRLLNSTKHLGARPPIQPPALRRRPSARAARAIAAYLASADVRLVSRDRAARLKWFRVRDLSRRPLERLQAAFGGNVIRKGRAYFYSTTPGMARRIVKRLAPYADTERLSSLLGVEK